MTGYINPVRKKLQVQVVTISTSRYLTLGIPPLFNWVSTRAVLPFVWLAQCVAGLDLGLRNDARPVASHMDGCGWTDCQVRSRAETSFVTTWQTLFETLSIDSARCPSHSAAYSSTSRPSPGLSHTPSPISIWLTGPLYTRKPADPIGIVVAIIDEDHVRLGEVAATSGD